MQHKNGANSNFSPEVQKAIETAKSSFGPTKKRVKSVDLFEKSRFKNELPKVAHLQGNLDSWMKQLTAVFVWDAIKKFDESLDWNKAFVQSPYWLRSDNPVPPDTQKIIEYINMSQEGINMESKIVWTDGWSAYRRSYPREIYQFYFTDAKDNDLIFKHRFYESYDIFVLFSANEKTINAIYDRATSYRKIVKV